MKDNREQEIIAEEILEDPRECYESFDEMTSSMKIYSETFGKIELFSSDYPKELCFGWVDGNSNRVWKIKIKTMKMEPYIKYLIRSHDGKLTLTKILNEMSNERKRTHK